MITRSTLEKKLKTPYPTRQNVIMILPTHQQKSIQIIFRQHENGYQGNNISIIQQWSNRRSIHQSKLLHNTTRKSHIEQFHSPCPFQNDNEDCKENNQFGKNTPCVCVYYCSNVSHVEQYFFGIQKACILFAGRHGLWTQKSTFPVYQCYVRGC